MSEDQDKKIVKGSVSFKKKSELQNLVETLIPKDVAQGIARDFKGMIFSTFFRGTDDIVHAFLSSVATVIEEKIFHDSPNATFTAGRTYTPYSKRTNDRVVLSRDILSAGSNSTAITPAKDPFGLDKIIFSRRDDAVMVLKKLRETIMAYQTVSVMDLFEIIGLDNYPFTARDYGWANLDKANIVMVPDGYLLDLPRAYPLDRGQ